MNISTLSSNEDYQQWLNSLKQGFRQRQIKAAVAVNRELLEFYWQLGEGITERQKHSEWGDGFITQLSKDLIAEFPEVKGFSTSNLKYIRRWVQYWKGDSAIGQQVVDQLTQIPWGHNLTIVSKSENHEEALFYVQQTLKDPYLFDFITLTDSYNERELEKQLVQHITQFLLELGAGFAYVGKQVPIQVSEQDFYLDLLFYHLKLRCYVVIELKASDFKPEYAGKLNFYINAVDAQLKTEADNPTIGLLLCRTKDKLIAEYALKGIETPIGVSQYQLEKALPTEFKGKLPSIEQLETELARELDIQEGKE